MFSQFALPILAEEAQEFFVNLKFKAGEFTLKRTVIPGKNPPPTPKN